MPTIAAGREIIFELPEAGEEKDWLADNKSAFEKRAADGDKEVADMLEEVQRRGLLE